MKILVTGAKGFVGKNLCLALERDEGEKVEVLKFDLENTREELERWLGECDFVFHLAGVNRPKDVSEFRTGNTVFTEDILERLAARGRAAPPVVLASSTQAALDNDYGRSKKAAEEAVFAYGERTGAPVFVYRFANVFGKWCRPNYNSAVATWCYNIAHDLPIQVRDPAATVTLIYIDDLVRELVGREREGKGKGERGEGSGREEWPCRNVERVEGEEKVKGKGERGEKGKGERGEGREWPCRNVERVEGSEKRIYSVEPAYTRTLGEITELIRSFHEEPKTLMVPDQADGFAKKLYATYLSYLPEEGFSYPLTMHCDARGSFTEVLHTLERGQVSVNVSKPGITKGQHWHHTKHEKFCVVSGKGLIQFRKMDGAGAKVIEYHVSGEKLEVVRIPPGYTHNIINEGEGDMVTLMWANEVFDPKNPDTFAAKV